MRQDELIENLEELVDKSSVSEVAEALSTLCSLKADHVRESWQGTPTAEEWEHASEAFAKVAGCVAV